MAGYLLGIDAGATKTAFILYDLERNRAWQLYGGCGNHEGLPGGYAELEKMMEAHLNRLCACAGVTLKDIAGAGLGVAGVDTRRQHGIIAGIFSKIGLERFALANDAVLGIKAECDAGICAVNGTGFCVYGIDRQGQTAQVGGLDQLSGDLGGGKVYAQRALAAVYSELEKGGPKTAMTGGALSVLGITDPGLFVERVSECMESPDSARYIRGMSMLLHDCAGAGDAVASSILRASGEEYARCVQGVLRHLPGLAEHGNVNLILVGSCFLRASCGLTRQSMEQKLKELCPEITFSIRPIGTEPVAGALFWALEQAGLNGDRELEMRVRQAAESAENIG